MPAKLKNIIGLKYNRLTIIGEAPTRRSKSGNSQRFVNVKCECGNELEVMLNSLVRGNTKSCGCGRLNGTKLSNKIYDGIVFGRLMVLGEVAGKRKQGGSIVRMMECECECGTIKNIRLGDMKSGKSQSCGCLVREVSSDFNSKKIVVGQQRGHLILIQELEKSIKYNDNGGVLSTIRNVEVLCERCGDVRDMTLFRFSNESQPNHCGCATNENIRKSLRVEVEVGKKYNRLTILKEVEPINFTISDKGHKYSRRRVQCECECGVIKDMNLASVVSGKSKSCGCLGVERMKELFTTHGLTTTVEGKSMYHRWYGMLSRCYDENNPSFPYYGGRGVKICERWKTDVMNFVNDMGYPPSNEYSLDRKNVDGDYELSNCRWATVEMQSMNKRSNKWYREGGKNPTI